jgi:hypothetical protein
MISYARSDLRRQKLSDGGTGTSHSGLSISSWPVRLVSKAWQVVVTWGQREPRMQTIISGWELVSRSAKGLGPYLMLEILMPGGTLLALLLFLYQRYRQ